MSNSIITAAGAALIAACQANEEILVIDKMIFADVPGLDTNVMPPANTVLPPAGQIMLQSDIAQSGLIGNDTVAYSATLGAAIGTFYINWFGLYSSAHNTLVAVCYVPRHYKFATDGFRLGNTLYKNFALQINNVSDLTGITINAATWQQDLTAILANYAPAHDHPYEPIGAVAAHNVAANPHVGMFDFYGTAIAAIDAHEGESDPHNQYLLKVSGAVIAAYGVVSASGAKISGSANWTVTRNSAGHYQLNVTDAGNYIVLAGTAPSGDLAPASEYVACDTIHAFHYASGYFQNNVAENIMIYRHQDGGGWVDCGWIFYAIKI